MKQIYIKPECHATHLLSLSPLLLPASGGLTTDEALIKKETNVDCWADEDSWESPFE